MQLNISGTQLRGFIKPLACPVKTLEGVDIDKIRFAITEEEVDRKMLTAVVTQPNYTVTLHLNLSGDPALRDPDVPAEEKAALQEAVDANAECGEAGMHWLMRHSDLKNIIDSIGEKKCDFIFDVGFLKVMQTDEKAEPLGCYRVEAFKRSGALSVADVGMLGKAVRQATGVLQMGQFADLLTEAINVCSFAGKKGPLCKQAIHLHFEGQQVRVEALTDTLAVTKTASINAPIDAAAPKKLHLSICVAAAQALKSAVECGGSDVYWCYDSTEGRLVVTCQPYTLSIAVEKVNQCELPKVRPGKFIVGLWRADVIATLRFAIASGYDRVLVFVEESKCVRMCTKDLRVDRLIVTQPILAVALEDRHFVLPTKPLLQAFRNFEGEVVELAFDDDNPYVHFSDSAKLEAFVWMK